MPMNSTHWATWLTSEKTLPWLGAIIAALIACWVNYQAHGVINNDGILYLEVAQLFDAGQWRQGVATYNWPLYPFLIMLVHQFSGLGFQISANLLAVLFFAATGLGLATLIRDLGGSRNTVIAGLALLLATPYLVGDILPMVVREHGYWAFHVWSLVYLLRFMQHHTWCNAILWGMLAIVCVLFRIEGLTYLVLAPLAMLADGSMPLAQRMRALCKANSILIATGVILAVLLMGHPALSLDDMGRLRDPGMILNMVLEQLSTGLARRADIIGQQALGSYLDDYGLPTLLLGMTYILLFKAATVTGLLQTGLAIGFWKKIKGGIPAPYWRLLCWLLILGLLNAVVILIKGFILPKRILIPIGIVIILMAAFGAAHLMDDMRNRPVVRNLFIALAAILLLLQFVSALRPSSPETRYERDAVEWVMQQSSAGSKIFFETDRMAFYSGKSVHRSSDWASIQEARWRNALSPAQTQTANPSQRQTALNEMADYDFMLVLIQGMNSQKESQLTEHLGQPVASFEGPRGKKKILVYRNPHAG